MSTKPLFKSKKSAMVMATLAHVTSLAVIITWLFIDGKLSGLALPLPFTLEMALRGLLVVLLVFVLLALSVWIIAGMIVRLDNTHFGPRGAVLWALVGIVYGLIWHMVLLLPINRFERYFVQFIVIGVSYWLVFQLVPQIRRLGRVWKLPGSKL